jgi:hypothetical protein
MNYYDIGKNFENSYELDDYLYTLKSQLTVQDYEKASQEIKQGWGAKQYPLRVAMTFFYLVGKSLNRQTVFYEDIWRLFGYGSHHTVTHPLKAIQRICIKNELPIYSVLVKSIKTKKVSDGFFRNIGREKEHEENCFRFRMIEMSELFEYVNEYFGIDPENK